MQNNKDEQIYESEAYLSDKHTYQTNFIYHLFLYLISIEEYILRVIPQGTVDNILGPDRLAGPKALEPNRCRQPTL